MTLPVIAVTMGDPAGIGPELCLKLVREPAVRSRCRPLIFGDMSILERVGERLDLPTPSQPLTPEAFLAGVLDGDIVDFGMETSEFIQPGVVGVHTGLASYRYVDAAVTAAIAQRVSAVVTGPIHKEAFHLAGIPYAGHTELLVDRTKAANACMMLTSEAITCSLVTAHVAFRDIPRLLTKQRILDVTQLTDSALERMRGRKPRLIACGLNPHGGEHGLLGNREEERVILPALEEARGQGIQIEGPLSPDTAFLPKYREACDGYICMYHDQGLIPLKALAFETAVNITLGLPIIRTSVDHGTALDIAWQGEAQVTSFVKAVDLAVQLAADATAPA